MPLEFKLYKDRSMKEEIPFLGFPNEVVEMGTTGVIEAYLVNLDDNMFEVESIKHQDENTEITLENRLLNPHEPVKLKLKWTPPVTMERKYWKPLKGNIIMRGRYIII